MITGAGCTKKANSNAVNYTEKNEKLSRDGRRYLQYFTAIREYDAIYTTILLQKATYQINKNKKVKKKIIINKKKRKAATIWKGWSSEEKLLNRETKRKKIFLSDSRRTSFGTSISRRAKLLYIHGFPRR